MKWNTGKKARAHTITIEISGSAMTVLADGDPVISDTDNDGMASGVVGIFSRGKGKNQFDKFTVKLNEPEAEPEAGGKGKAKKANVNNSDGGMTSGVVGIFSRGKGKNQFDKFTVNQN